MLPNLFQGIFESYNTSLMAGVNATITAGLTAMAAILQILGCMFVAVYGYLTLTGNMTPKTGLSMVMRIVLVQAAMTPVYYNEFVRDFMLDWLPNWIAQSVGLSISENAGAAQFDALRRNIVNITATLHERTMLTMVAERLEIFLLEIFCELVVALSFFMWVFVRGLLALIVSIGPFVIVTYLFNATRTFAENWLGSLAGVSILLLLVSVLLRIIVVQFTQFIGAVDTAGVEIDQAIEGLVGIFISMAFGIGLLFYLPRLAFSIGSGAAFDAAGGSVMAARAAAGAASAAASAAKAAGRGARATALGGRAAGKFIQGRFTR